MTPEMRQNLKQLLIKHEGYENFPYVDTVGKITIGIGYNLSDRGVSDNTIISWFNEDVDFFYSQLSSHFSWFPHLCEPRQLALIDMAFMGWQRFLTFEKMFTAFENGDMDSAANEILNSDYAKKLPSRAKDLANIIRTGTTDV